MHIAMVDESDGNENFFWENQQWMISDISGGDISIDVLFDGVAGEDDDKGKKVLDSSTSNSPNTLGGGAVVPMEATIGKKRSATATSGGVAVEDDDKGKKVLDSSTSNSPNTLGDGVVVPMEATIGKKRSATATSGGGGGGGGGEGKGGGGEADHEMHLWIERERRKKMRNMFSSLQALIPHFPPKADKSTIVDEAVIYIKSLQQTLNQLQKQKLERLHGMSNNMNFVGPSRLTQQKLALMKTRESFMADKGSSSNLATINSTNPSPSFSSIPRFPTTMNFQTWFSPNVVLKICGEDAHISVCSLKKPGMLSMICNILEKNKLEVVSAHVFADNFRNMYMIQIRGNFTDYQLPEGFLVREAFKQAAVDIMLWITNT